MAVKFLEQIVKASEPAQKDLLTVLVKNLGKYYPERSHKTVHASDVTKEDFCARRFRLMDVHNLKAPDRYLAPALKATFDVGRATADLYCNEWIGDRGVGHWRCMSCGNLHIWTTKPSKCPKCHAQGVARYEEVEFVCEDSGISGSIDNLAQLSPNKVTITELKIMKGADFEKLAAPLAEHRVRTALYIELVRNSGSPWRHLVDLTGAKVLYISREFGKKNADTGQILPFKEFDVAPAPDLVAPYLERGKTVKIHRQNNTMPERVCPYNDCKQAKACNVAHLCFGG